MVVTPVDNGLNCAANVRNIAEDLCSKLEADASDSEDMESYHSTQHKPIYIYQSIHTYSGLCKEGKACLRLLHIVQCIQR